MGILCSVAVTHCVGSRSGGNRDQMKELNASLLTNTTLARLIKGGECVVLCDVTAQLVARVFSAPMIPAPTLRALSEVLSLSQQALVKGDAIHCKIEDIPTPRSMALKVTRVSSAHLFIRIVCRRGHPAARAHMPSSVITSQSVIQISLSSWHPWPIESKQRSVGIPVLVIEIDCS
jgi:hypothetical protein